MAKQSKILQRLQRDHIEVGKTLAELKGMLTARFDDVIGEIKALKEVDQTLHDRISRKDDKIEDVEKRCNTLENRTTALETTSRNNKYWIGIGFSVAIVIATLIAKYV